MDMEEVKFEDVNPRVTKPMNVELIRRRMIDLLRDAQALGVKVSVTQVPRDAQHPAMRDHIHRLEVWPAWYVTQETHKEAPQVEKCALITDWMFIGHAKLGDFCVLFGKLENHPRLSDFKGGEMKVGRTTPVQQVTVDVTAKRIWVKTKNTLYELVDPFADWTLEDRKRWFGLIPGLEKVIG